MAKANDKTFESIKHLDDEGREFWYARELMPILQYAKWENFAKVIKTAQIACKISQQEVTSHFVETKKEIEMPKGEEFSRGFPDVRKTPQKPKTKKVVDYKLTRYACYLIVMNGDPRKKVIAHGQTYFAVKTRQQEFQELYNQLTEDDKRLFIRGDIKQKNMLLADAAKNAGIITAIEYALFQDAGYKGLYGGETRWMIAERKGLKDGEEILDYMGSEELAANLFRITQTEGRLKREGVTDKDDATEIHHMVGKEVRGAIERIGGVMPEQLPKPDRSIQQIESEKKKQIKASKNKKEDD